MSSLLLFAQAIRSGSTEMWVGLIAVLAAIVLFGIVMLLVKQYKRCPSNRVLVIYGKAGTGHEAATCIHGGAKFVVPLIQDYAWLSLEPMQIEIPLRGALSMENIRVNVPSVFTVAIGTTPELMQNAAIRLLGLNRMQISEAGRRHHLRPAPPGDRLDADRGHQPRPRQVPRSRPELARAGAAQDRPGADQRQHHRHHRRVGLHRGHRPEGGLAGDPEGPRRRGRQRADGRDPRGRGRAREGGQRGQRPQGPRDRHPRGHARAGGPRGRAGEGAEDRRADGRLPARRRGEGRRARDAHQAGRGRRHGGRGRKPGQGRHRRLAGRACR